MGLGCRIIDERGRQRRDGVRRDEPIEWGSYEAVFALADRVLVLASGAIVAGGPPDQIKADPKVKLAYLGDDEDA